MSTTTTNLGLTKPSLSDDVDVRDLNANFDAIDAAVGDSTIVKDASYVHTDENFTTAEKTKLDGIATGANVNVVTGVDGTTISIDSNGVISVALPNLDGAGY